MRRHFAIGPVDLWIVETGLDNGGLRIVRHQQTPSPADGFKGSHMGVDPVGQRLRPARMRKVKLDAPSTATKSCALRISPLSRSITTGTPSPA
jgi:hypothetical protein